MTNDERDLDIALRRAVKDGVDGLSVEQLDLISSAVCQAQYEAAQRKCKHLNLRLDGSNSPGAPFYCLDCGTNALPWTALNGLLAELNEVINAPAKSAVSKSVSLSFQEKAKCLS